ncbi:S60 ribosomal protein L36a [Tieghemostelium lacteum]|uniref:S60 ribosomal protein L36a n=1 Tax=Tieghemostelium lacteum TaxID=361077 RepID=A0A151Z7V8_TIELA|nr:S60 ribosomal protein L36a [Tieghemostelium lacteum]|eukprot:KYQ90041.1 S60 ribosomal protein L36a [Tieghemostelium lacteum]
MVTCPECKTEYEKEAKYCFKCRIAFTDDIPENISKYLKRNTSSGNITSGKPIGTDKPPLNRNTSLGGIKPSGSPTTNIQVSSGTPTNNSPISTPSYTTTTNLNNVTSSTSPPTSVNNSTNFNNTNNSTTSSGSGTVNRPRLASSPTPPTHPLPPTPTRMSFPVTLPGGSTPITTYTQPNNVQSPKPPISSTSPTSSYSSPITGVASSTTSSGNHSNINSNSNRTTSPTPTSGSNYENVSSPLIFDQQQPPSLPQYTAPLKRPLSSRIPPPPPGKKTVKAIWGCVPEQPGDLEFKEGDIITVISKDTDGSGWWLGSVHGKTGLFPFNYTVEEN